MFNNSVIINDTGKKTENISASNLNIQNSAALDKLLEQMDEKKVEVCARKSDNYSIQFLGGLPQEKDKHSVLPKDKKLKFIIKRSSINTDTSVWIKIKAVKYNNIKFDLKTESGATTQQITFDINENAKLIEYTFENLNDYYKSFYFYLYDSQEDVENKEFFYACGYKIIFERHKESREIYGEYKIYNQYTKWKTSTLDEKIKLLDDSKKGDDTNKNGYWYYIPVVPHVYQRFYEEIEYDYSIIDRIFGRKKEKEIEINQEDNQLELKIKRYDIRMGVEGTPHKPMPSSVYGPSVVYFSAFLPPTYILGNDPETPASLDDLEPFFAKKIMFDAGKMEKTITVQIKKHDKTQESRYFYVDLFKNRKYANRDRYNLYKSMDITGIDIPYLSLLPENILYEGDYHNYIKVKIKGTKETAAATKPVEKGT